MIRLVVGLGNPGKEYERTRHNAGFWLVERFAASSGDLGVSIGIIRPNDPKETQSFPFFTVWRRDGPDKPWRYIAE